MTDSKQYCLKWNNFSDNILTSLESLWGDEDFVDVTIACEGHSIKAHKVVLSACSLYIKKLLKENPCQHPIIILKDVALPELQALLSFMYNGQVMVAEDQIPRLLHTAEVLEIRGLADMTKLKQTTNENGEHVISANTEFSTPPPPVPPPPPSQHPPKRPCASNVESQNEDTVLSHSCGTASPWGNGTSGLASSSLSIKNEQQARDEDGEGEDSEEDEEYEDEDMEDDEDAGLNSFQPNGSDPKPHDQSVMDAVHFSRMQSTMNQIKEEIQESQIPNRAMMPLNNKAADLAARVSLMEDNMLPGDVLVIGETHITPARCLPRPLKPPLENVKPQVMVTSQCFQGDQSQTKISAADGRLTLEMSLRMQVQRKLEAQRESMRAMERMRQCDTTLFNDNMMNAPMDCSPFPGVSNGVHLQDNGHSTREEGVPPVVGASQVPQVAPASQVGQAAVATIPLPLSPDLQLKMLMCRDFKKYTNMLLVAVFGRDVLATHCLNGSKGSAKPRLDTEKVTRVIATVMDKFDVPASTVREAIRVKLNNEDKLKKRSKRAANPLL